MFGKKNAAKTCPLLKRACIGSACMWATTVRGTNPNTGNPVDEEACAVAWLPVLLIENSQQTRQAGAAVESLRNVVREVQTEATQVTLAAMTAIKETVKEFGVAVHDMPQLIEGARR